MFRFGLSEGFRNPLSKTNSAIIIPDLPIKAGPILDDNVFKYGFFNVCPKLVFFILFLHIKSRMCILRIALGTIGNPKRGECVLKLQLQLNEEVIISIQIS